MKVATVDIVILDGETNSVTLDTTESEAVTAIIALVDAVANRYKIQHSMLLGHCGQVLCPDNCLVIKNEE